MRQRKITVAVLDRAALKEYTNPDRNYVVISITDPGRPDAQLANDPARVDQLRLSFHDTDKDEGGTGKNPLVGISLAQARQIVDFVSKWHRNGIDHFVCQCEIGIARSSAIAAAILKIHNDANDDSYVFKEDLVYIPNMRVYATVLYAAFGMTQ